jgi:hypothetical protein
MGCSNIIVVVFYIDHYVVRKRPYVIDKFYRELNKVWPKFVLIQSYFEFIFFQMICSQFKLINLRSIV